MSETGRACPDDLLALGRRRSLSDLERRVVTSHLARCESCRGSSVMAAFLREPGDVLPGDADIVARVADRASVALGTRSARARRPIRSVAGVIVALSLVTTGAFALIAGPGRFAVKDRPEAVAPPKRTGQRVTRAPAPERAPLQAPASSPQAAPMPLASVSVSATDVPRRAPRQQLTARADRPGAEAASPGPPTPATLFADANAARRAGQLQRAVDLYEGLRRRFPDSAEALLAAISVGDLLLTLDLPARALAAFDAYLAALPSGALREEALFGRARCLRKLGRDAAEADTWKLLRREFPGSAYQPLARRRLLELER